MRKATILLIVLILSGLAGLMWTDKSLLADGTETLGPPSIPIATGTSIIAASTGLAGQPGIVELTLPPAVTVTQVLLYWEGQMTSNVAGDNTIRINGAPVVTGALIGGPTFLFSNASGNVFSSSFRADITNLDLIGPGYNTLVLDDLVTDSSILAPDMNPDESLLGHADRVVAQRGTD